MKIILALGNPERKFNFTRHNLGFFAADLFAKVHELEWAENVRFKAITSTYKAGGDSILIVKPLTYYNLVGETLGAVMRFYKVPVEDILVVCDDLSLPFGTVRTRLGGSDGGNNGLRSVIAQVGTEFKRVRIGTDNDMRAKMGDVDFVLAKFSEEEREELPEVLGKAIKLMGDFACGQFEAKKAH